MKCKLNKLTAVFSALVLLAAICTGCGNAKPEPTQAAAQPSVQLTEQPTVPPTAENPETVQAPETAAQKAMLQYAELLKSHSTILYKNTEILEDLSFGYEENIAQFGMHYDYFALLDLDNDGIPELIANTIINNGWMPVSVFQYQEAENQVQLLKDPLDPASHATFECMSTAAGSYNLYICREHHLHSNWGGDTPIGFQEENHAYVLGSSGLEAVDCTRSNFTDYAENVAVHFWDVMGVNDEETVNERFGGAQ